MANKSQENSFATNRRARYDYDVIDTFTAGLVLDGHEAKAIRSGNADLKGAYVTFRGDELWLTNATIRKYRHATTIQDYDETRPRKLLVTKRERELLRKAKHGSLQIIPLRLFAAGPYIKLKIATARSKRKYDKRQTIKRRDTQRDIEKSIRKRVR